jgi:hypothetical protein
VFSQLGETLLEEGAASCATTKNNNEVRATLNYEMGSLSPVEASPASPATDSRSALVDRVNGSSAFAKCNRLQDFLSYICDLTLSGRASELNEQNIGTALFGRSHDYDTSIDGIVRTQASRLRRRLELYFHGEGVDEPLMIVLRRGSYVPIFESRSTQPALKSTPEAEAATGSEPAEVGGVQQAAEPSRRRVLVWLLPLAALAIVFAIFASRGTPSLAALGGPANHPLWSGIFQPNHSTLIVPGDSGLVIFEGLAVRDVHLNEYLRGEYRTVVPSSPNVMQSAQTNLAGRRYTSIVDLNIAISLGQLALASHSKLEVRYARDLRPNDLKSGNVILVGAAEANPWLELFERNMNFILQDDRQTHVFNVINRSPQPNEPQQWHSISSDPEHRVFGVVAFLPNLAGDGNALILEGTSMSGTEAAWDFVHDDAQLLPFLNRIRRSDGKIPHFELLLGTNNMDASAVRSTVLAWRVIG